MADEKSDDLISLEDLVTDTPAGSAALSSDTSAPKVHPAAAPEAAKKAASSPTDEIDWLLSIEDPAFAAGLSELKDLSAEAEVAPDKEIDKIVHQAKVDATARGFKKLALIAFVRPIRRVNLVVKGSLHLLVRGNKEGIPWVGAKLKACTEKMKAGLLSVVGSLKAGVNWFSNLPRASKLLFVSVVLLGAVSVTVAMFTFKGNLLPNFQQNYLLNFATVADHVYAIEPHETWENFNDPLLHPEHVVLIERIIANLARSDDGKSNPMALIDIYIEAGSHPAAVEIKDREGEARDVIGRTLEKMEYEELATVAGKMKLKVFLRKDLNQFMTQGRVRRIFFKSIILKP